MIYKIKLDGKVLYYPGDRQAAVINPELDLQTGYAGELTLKVPPLNPLYGEIHNRKSMVSVYRGNTEIFYGEVRTREKDRFKNQPVKATGALSFLADSILPQQEWHDISPRDLLDAWLQLHNNQVEDRKKIYTGVVTIHDSNDSLYRITDRENTLEAIRDKLVDRLGGYLRLRHENDKLYLDWLTIQEYGKYCEQPIQFGENLMDYSETMTADDVITALIPLGAAIEQETDENASEFERLEKNVDITSVNDGKDYIYSKEAVENFGWVWRTEKWDDVSVPANLLKKATEFLTSNQYESLVISLTAVDLSLFGQDYDSFLKHWPYVYCPTLGNLFTRNANPKVGDIVIFYRGGTFAHTGIVTAVIGDRFYTIEGNTSGASEIVANGGGVCAKSYLNSKLPGTKFCTPDYSIVNGETSNTKENSNTVTGGKYMFEPETVQLGSAGTSVLLLQEILVARGFKGRNSKVLDLDREAGDNTIYALKAYQKSRNGALEVDGVCGPATWKDLIAI